jgi:hypothetical protein
MRSRRGWPSATSTTSKRVWWHPLAEIEEGTIQEERTFPRDRDPTRSPG